MISSDYCSKDLPFLLQWQGVKRRADALEYGQPLKIASAKNAKVWDDSGKEYIDFLMSWGSVLLGHNNDDIHNVLKDNIENAEVSNGHLDIEFRVADLFNSFYPHPTKTAFFLNGSDALTAAVRIARQVTNREKVVFSGYHGWHDWAQPESAGVLRSSKITSSDMRGHDMDDLIAYIEEEGNNLACVVFEIPIRQDGGSFAMDRMHALSKQYSFLIIYDEVKSGIRMGLTPGFQIYKKLPHMTVYGKAFAAGLPFSALVVDDAITERMVGGYSLSATYWGFPLSLYVVELMIEKVRDDQFVDSINSLGQYFVSGFNHVLKSVDLDIYADEVFSMPAIISHEPKEVTDHFHSVLFEHGIYMRRPNHCSFISLSHTKNVLDDALSRIVVAAKDVTNNIS